MAIPATRLGIEVELEPLSRDSVLGRGAFGVVRRGRYVDETGESHAVAVKFVNDLPLERARKSLENELNIFDSLEPAPRRVVRCFGGSLGSGPGRGGDSGEDCYIVLELMAMSLADLMASEALAGRRTYRQMLRICAQIAEGLEFLHGHGIIHYDLKPSNVLLDEGLNVKLADFGLSKMKMHKNSLDASFKGQIGYMAPEVVLALHFKGVRATDKLDTYSLGVLIWECVTQRQAGVDACNSEANGGQQQGRHGSECYVGNSRLSIPKGAPPSLRNLIAECVEVDPADRPGCGEIRQRLLALAEAEWAKRHPWDTALEGLKERRAAARRCSWGSSSLGRFGMDTAVYPAIDMKIRVMPPPGGSRVLGSGPYAYVEEGLYVDAGGRSNSVAVKYANRSELRAQFEHELDMFGRIPLHPNILRCFGGSLGHAGKARSSPNREIFVVTEKLGQSLRLFLAHNTVDARGTPSDTRYAVLLRIFHDVALALAHLHQHGIIYGNLNPQNVLLDDSGRAKLGSLMFSRFLAGAKGFPLPDDIAVVSPEILMGRFNRRQKYTEKMDIFALGALMWGCLEVDGVMIDSVLREPKETSSGTRTKSCPKLSLSDRFPQELSTLIQDCTEFQPAERPCCREVADRLAALMEAPWAGDPVFKFDGCRRVCTRGIPWVAATAPHRYRKDKRRDLGTKAKPKGEGKASAVPLTTVQGACTTCPAACQSIDTHGIATCAVFSLLVGICTFCSVALLWANSDWHAPEPQTVWKTGAEGQAIPWSRRHRGESPCAWNWAGSSGMTTSLVNIASHRASALVPVALLVAAGLSVLACRRRQAATKK